MRQMVGGYPGYPRIPQDTTPGYPRIPPPDTLRYHALDSIAAGWAARIGMRTMQNHVRVSRFFFCVRFDNRVAARVRYVHICICGGRGLFGQLYSRPKNCSSSRHHVFDIGLVHFWTGPR
jgi:hypothetical protein